MQTSSGPDHLWPEIWSKMSKAAQRKEKQEWAIEKPKLDNARRLSGIYFSGLDDVKCKETVKNVQKIFICRWKQLCLCKVGKTECKETCARPEPKKSKYACIVDANESTRKRLEGTQPKDHEKYMKITLQSCAQVHPYASSNKNTGGDSRSGQRIEENACLAADESQKQKRCHSRGTEKKKKNSSFFYADGHLSSQEIGVVTTILKNTKAEWYSEVT